MKLNEAIQQSFGAAHRCADLTEALWADGAPRTGEHALAEARELVRMSRHLSASALDVEARLLNLPEPARG